MDTETTEFKPLSIDEANELVLEHRGWAESIARSVARSWNMDWQLDGLDGAAMEALLFCARRFQPGRGVPFRGYARKRIHEASTDAARKSRSWQKGLGASTKAERQAREVSAELFNVFPELRDGELPHGEDGEVGEDDTRAALRQLLLGASIIAARQGILSGQPDDILEYKRMIQLVAELEPVHQMILWKVYWEGLSMRSVATEWETDELNIIREHKELLAMLQKGVEKKSKFQRPKVRPGLKALALKFKREDAHGPFTKLLEQTRRG